MSGTVTGTGISPNGHYLALVQPADPNQDELSTYYTETDNIVSVYDTATLQLEWTCDVNRWHYLAINDSGNFLFVITHRQTFEVFECRMKKGVKVVIEHDLSEISTTLDAMCFLHDNHLIVGSSEGKLVKIDLNKLQRKTKKKKKNKLQGNYLVVSSSDL